MLLGSPAIFSKPVGEIEPLGTCCPLTVGGDSIGVVHRWVDSHFPEEFFGGQRMVERWGKIGFLVAWLHSKMSEALKEFWLASVNVSCSEGSWLRQWLAVGGGAPCEGQGGQGGETQKWKEVSETHVGRSVFISKPRNLTSIKGRWLDHRNQRRNWKKFWDCEGGRVPGWGNSGRAGAAGGFPAVPFLSPIVWRG